MEHGTLLKWHVKEGDFVEDGDLIIEVATDKATVEHHILDGGWLRKILVQQNTDAQVNEPIAILTENKDESIEGYQPEGIKPKEAQKVPEDKESLETTPQQMPKETSTFRQASFVPEAPRENYHFEFPTETTVGKTKASPLAKKLAKERGLDLSSVKGTGPGGRVVSRDLALAQPLRAFGKKTYPTVPPGTYEEEPLTPMRKVIAQRLQDAKTFIPHFYVTITVDAEPLSRFRDELTQLEFKMSFNDCILKACSIALAQHPEINSGFNSANNTLIRFKTVDISVAVSLSEGLITPIISHANYKSLGEISAEMKSLIKKAREGKLQPHEYKGGSFTVSNLGMYGVKEFQAIINPPQAAILAISGILETPIVKDNLIVPGKTMNLTLSVDHRVIDGVLAAGFLNTLKKLLENPLSLLI